MKHKTATLERPLLGAAVAKALGSDGGPVWMPPFSTGPHRDTFFGDPSTPSTRWDHGGPIIEQERIALLYYEPLGATAGPREPQWTAAVGGVGHVINELLPFSEWREVGTGDGPTPLIAAMRAYVASKFGEEVELP